jgi:hypothetical protein
LRLSVLDNQPAALDGQLYRGVGCLIGRQRAPLHWASVGGLKETPENVPRQLLGGQSLRQRAPSPAHLPLAGGFQPKPDNSPERTVSPVLVLGWIPLGQDHK